MRIFSLAMAVVCLLSVVGTGIVGFLVLASPVAAAANWAKASTSQGSSKTKYQTRAH
jgi:hypothetical protein